MAGSEQQQGDVEQVQGGAAPGNAEAVAEAAEGSVLRDERMRHGSAQEQGEERTETLGHEAASEQDSQGPGEDEEQRPQGSKGDVPTQGQGSGEEVVTQEQGPQGSKEDEQGPQGSKEDDVSTQAQGCEGSVEDVATQEQGTQGSMEEVATQEQGTKEDVPTEEQGCRGSREDVPTEGQGSKEDARLAEEHASTSQTESREKPEDLKQEADANETDIETVSAESKQASDENVSSDVKNTVELLEKLEIQESSDGASNDDDDVSSSIESTANSGAVHSQDDKAVSGDEETSRRKKRVDLRHHFVRDIVKIQQDRDQFEKQCQLKKQEDFGRNTVQASSRRHSSSSVREDQDTVSSVNNGSRRSSRRSTAQATPRSPILGTPRQPVRRQLDEVKKQAVPSMGYSSYVSTQDVRYQPDLPGFHPQGQYDKWKQPVRPLYRPPSRRDTDPEPIQVRGLPVTPKAKNNERLPGNLKITLSTEGREVTELRSPNEEPSWKQPEATVGSKTSASLPASFEFKAKAVGMQPRSDTSVADEDHNNNRRHRRSRNRNRSGSSSRTFQDSEVVSTPRSIVSTHTERGDNRGLEVNARRIQRPEAPPSIYPVEELPPKDKPFAGENTNSVKWSDIVDSEVEQSPRFDSGLENNSTRDRGRQKKPRQKKAAAAAGAAKDPVAVAAGEQADKETPKKTVWERLGPRVSDSPRAVYFEETRTETESRLEGIRMPSERHYFCKDGEPEHDTAFDSADVVVRAAAAAYKDSKQKRVRMELYVPRRGGARGAGGGGSSG